MTCWRWLLLGACALLAAAEPVDGLDITLFPWAPGWRADAPLLLDLRAATTRGTRQGRVVARLERSEMAIATWTSDELLLSPQERVQTVVLPPLPGEGELRAVISWQDTGGTTEQGRGLLFDADAGTDAVLFCLDGSAGERQRVAALLNSRPAARRPAEDLPEQALAYTAFSAVVLGGQQAAHLRRAQREALARWVAGGGLLYLAGDAVPDWLPGPRDRLGLVVPLTGDVAPDAGLAAKPPSALIDESWSRGLWAGGPQLPSRSELLSWGALFVAVVGPLEFLLLSLLHRRRWTWVVFPATACAASLVLVAWAERRWSGAGGTQTLVILDADPGGTVRRASELSLAMSGSTTLRQDQGDGVLAARSLGSRDAPPATLTGSAAGTWTSTQRIDQWIRVVDRRTRLVAEPPPWPLPDRPRAVPGSAITCRDGAVHGAPPLALFNALVQPSATWPTTGGAGGADLAPLVPAGATLLLSWRRDERGWTVVRRCYPDPAAEESAP
ncbi:MAG: hypothetical protein L6R48_08880 [Planctomycetes bacterium]|nr:hypothetical protein [Planctomycetota bacterium]